MKAKWFKWSVAALCLLGFIIIACNLERVSAIDGAVYGVISSWISPAATVFFMGCTSLVSPIFLLLVSLAIVLLLPHKEYRIPVLINLCVAIILNLSLKQLFTRPRPTEVLHIITETGFSFPSGHSMAATCFYGFLIYLIWKLCKNKAWRAALTALLSLVVVLVCVSRIYLGVHYFTDVFSGMLISVCYLTIFTSVVNAFFAEEKSFRPRGVEPDGQNRLAFSFLYAFDGIAAGFKSERNMVIHFSAMATVITFGAMLGISKTEWMICIILFGLVIMAELMNTAVETVVDIVCPYQDPRAKRAKDLSAGAVLMVAIAAAVIGIMIFLPKLIALIQNGL